MPAGTIVFVHGTGVRLKNYKRSLAIAEDRARAAGIEAAFVECAWGDPLGVVFEGLSLPDPPTEQELRAEAEDFARWSWLIDDPLFELDKLTIRDTSEVKDAPPPPGKKSPAQELWEQIEAYQPSLELRLLLKRSGLEPFWEEAWLYVIRSEVAELAFERSAHELPEASNVLARALVAQLYAVAWSHDHPGPSRASRDALVMRLLDDWKQVVYGLSDFFANIFKRAATQVLRRHRNNFTDLAALPIGDVLLYQSRGAEVRNFIRDKIVHADPPVTVVAHSLGGIACFDLLALRHPPAVDRLVTVGSQAAFLYEIEVLTSLKPPQSLPAQFPRWLNVYDRNDFLSCTAKRLFPDVEELEVESGQPFPESHSAYFANHDVWRAIHEFTYR
jgi:hypothetical protein